MGGHSEGSAGQSPDKCQDGAREARQAAGGQGAPCRHGSRAARLTCGTRPPSRSARQTSRGGPARTTRWGPPPRGSPALAELSYLQHGGGQGGREAQQGQGCHRMPFLDSRAHEGRKLLIAGCADCAHAPTTLHPSAGTAPHASTSVHQCSTANQQQHAPRASNSTHYLAPGLLPLDCQELRCTSPSTAYSPV